MPKTWLPEDKIARVLDFGGGLGHQLLSLWCAGYANLEGVEIGLQQVKITRKAAKGRVSIFWGDLGDDL